MKYRMSTLGLILLSICILGHSALAEVTADQAGLPSGQDKYAQAERFLPVNATSSIFNASVDPHWIAGKDSFWYLKNGMRGDEFILVDIQNRTKAAAFNQTSLAASLQIYA